MRELYILILTLIAALIAAFSQYIFKRSLPKFKMNLKGILSLFKYPWLITAGLMYVVSLIIYLFALKSGELSFVYPAFASTFIFVLLIAKFSLKEHMSANQIVGLLLVFIGIFLVTMT